MEINLISSNRFTHRVGFQVIMIRSDPAECAMESRIAHEWDILGTGCCSVCLFSVCMHVSISLFIYHYPTHTRTIFLLTCRNFLSPVFFQIGCLPITLFYFYRPNALFVALWLLVACHCFLICQELMYFIKSNQTFQFLCDVLSFVRWCVCLNLFLMTHESLLMTSSYIHRPLHEGI
jgi:hypothetical protein